MGRRGPQRRKSLLFFVLSLLLLLASIAAITAHNIDHTRCDQMGYRCARPLCRRTLYDPFENNFYFSRIALDTLARDRHRQMAITRYYVAIKQNMHEDVAHKSFVEATHPTHLSKMHNASPSPLNQEDDGL